MANVVPSKFPFACSFLAAWLLAEFCAASPGAAQQTAAALSPQAPVRSVAAGYPRAKAEAAAARIDRLLAAGLARHQQQPTDLVDDPTFLRRAYLQIVGRIPNLEEAEAFLGDAAADKRARLVDALFDSPGYTSSECDFWFDLLRVKSRQRQVSGEPFAHWIREAVRKGMPYDEFVRAMLTATGPAHAEGNGATGFLLRDENMPHDAMANTLRLFLGTRVECAQCHNHPFDKWTQRDFYAMAAFYGGLRYRIDLDREVGQQLRQQLGTADDRQKAAVRRLMQTYATGIAGNGTGVDRLPADYKYTDAKPRDLVHAATLFGAEARLPKPTPPPAARGRARPGPPGEIDSRRAFADWLTDARNPRFARVIVGRVWQRLFGRALLEPVDDLKDDSQAVHPELQKELERLLVDLHFDLRQFERVLCLSRLFQQQCLPGDPPADQAFLFQAPLLRRLSAEQLWDSLLTLVFADLDSRLRPTDARAREVYDRQAELSGTPDQVTAAVQRELLRFTDPQKFRELLRAQLPAQPQLESAERQQRVRELQRDAAQARRRGDRAALEQTLQQLAVLGVPRPGERAVRGREGDLLRASDLLQPAPANHPLRQFGQSDRETLDGATRAATVPQALTLLNGTLAGGESSIRHAIDQAATPAAKVRTAFLATLSREPSPAESERWCEQLRDNAAPGAQDLLWVLVNCNEFRFWR